MSLRSPPQRRASSPTLRRASGPVAGARSRAMPDPMTAPASRPKAACGPRVSSPPSFLFASITSLKYFRPDELVALVAAGLVLEEIVHLTLGLFASHAVALLDLANELITLAFDDVEVVVRQLAPLLLHLAAILLPIALHLVAVHDHPPLAEIWTRHSLRVSWTYTESQSSTRAIMEIVTRQRV